MIPRSRPLALVQRLQQEFPRQALRVIHCPESLGLNGKVSNLAQMLPQARYEHIIINDSDIVVPPDYLRRVMSPFADPAVGMVTTLYRGIAGSDARIEAGRLSDSAPTLPEAQLLARAMEGGIRFGLGATIATTKKRPGGDWRPGCVGESPGRRLRTGRADFGDRSQDRAGGYTVPETALPDYSFGEFWLHQMRWARNVKDRRRKPGQYVGLIATFGLAWAMIAVLARPFSWWTWAILAITAAARLTSAIVVVRGSAERSAGVAPSLAGAGARFRCAGCLGP